MSVQREGERSRKIVGRNGRPNNALQASILAYLRGSYTNILDIKVLPKRYTIYSPLLILPVNFISTSSEWQTIYRSLSQSEKQKLFASIASAFEPQGVTHIAINAAISPESPEDGSENVMRSPSSITPVYGDFGPLTLLHPDKDCGQPNQADFDAAFWVSSIQNGGIVQTWASLWTMFSRGNITEKARILGEGDGMRGLTPEELGEDLSNVLVADLYVGIGYFAFSYLERGVAAVFGWEINGWSVEGLRRGCGKNGWECVVVRVAENGQLEQGDLEKIAQCLQSPRRGKCIVVWGNNESAARVLEDVQKSCQERAFQYLSLRHVNLGLLPTARTSWRNAVRILDARCGGWLHVHENVDIKEVDTKQAEIVAEFEQLVQTNRNGMWHISCCHIEQVKTYAPGVMHCVFDIEVATNDSIVAS
jgi:tRNA wybutosine-synthesizing protein 2